MDVEIDDDAGTATLRARKVVVAAGPWLAHDPAFADVVHGLPLVVTRQPRLWFTPRVPAPFATGALPCFIHFTTMGTFYGISATDERGHVKACRHHGGRPSAADTLDRVVTEADVDDVRAYLRRHVPLADGPVARGLVCMSTSTHDEHFVVGASPAHRAVVLLSPCSGHGYKMASVCGEIAADIVTGTPSGLDVSLFAPGRFPAARPRTTSRRAPAGAPRASEDGRRTAGAATAPSFHRRRGAPTSFRQRGAGMSGGTDDEAGDNVVRVDFAARKTKPKPPEGERSRFPVAAELGPERPEKLRVFSRLIERGMVMITLDARRDNPRVPPRFAGELHLNLNFSHRFGIDDFAYDDDGVRASLSFGGQPFFCDIPWTAVYQMTSAVDAERVMWPDSLPAELHDLLPPQARPAPPRPAPQPTEATTDDDEPRPPSPPRPTLRRVK